MEKTKKTSVKTYSLLDDPNFMVKFNCYQARPHILITFNDTSKTKYEVLNDEQKGTVINLALKMVSKHGLEESGAFLSQHCGPWYNSYHNYHAHLCVGNEKYLSILKKDMFYNWRYTDAEVKAYPKSNLKEEVEEINSIQNTVRTVSAADNDLFHPSEPRVGFIDLKENKPADYQAWLNVQKRMMAYADERKIIVNGCHVCLVLDNKTYGFDIDDSKCLLGFIEVTGAKFYRDLCPNEMRGTWFKNFKQKSRGYSPW